MAILGTIIAFTVLSTVVHYTHNYLEIEHYPPADYVSNETTRMAILITWPTLSALGVFGYWLHSRRLYPPAYACLVAYSVLGFATLGHFTEGSPHIPAFFYATIFTDALAGLALVLFVTWSAFGNRVDARTAP